MAQKGGARRGGSGKRKNITKSRQRFMAKKSTRKISRKFGRIRRADYAVKRLTDELT